MAEIWKPNNRKNKKMKTLITLAIVVGILIIAIIWGMKAWNKILFKLSFEGIDLSTIDLASLASFGQTSGKLLLGIQITNNNPFDIPFDKMKTFLYYDGTLIAESSGNLSAQSFKSLASSDKILNVGNGVIVKEVTDYVNVHINSASAKLIKDTVAKQNPKVNYTVQLSVFGVPLTYSDYFIASI